MIYRFILALLLILPAIGIHGAILEGKVTDAKTGETLPGATVVIKGTTEGDITNLDGKYRLKDLSAGRITVVATFIGYHPQEYTVEITEDVLYRHDFLLVANTTDLSEVIISGRASGQVKTLNDQKVAPNIMNIISEEQIISFPDLNAADALQRVPGITLQRDQGDGKYVQLRGTPPELTNFNVNGIQLPSPESSIRTVGMDVINASQIQTIEVAKVLTPDMNGDAIGGSINLITKRAENPEPEFNVVLAGGYNNLRQTPNSEMQLTFSQRSGKVGFMINANFLRSEQGADNMEFDYEKGVFFGGSGQDNFNIQYTEVQLRHYDLIRQRIGLSGTLDYYIDEHNVLFFSGMFNRFSDDETRRRKVYTLDDATSERNYLYGGIEHDVRDREKIQSISTVSIGGEHKLRWAEIEHQFAWSEATEDVPDYMEAVFENPGQAINIRFNVDDPDFPVATFPAADGSSNAFDYENYRLDQLLFEEENADDQNLIGRLDVKIPYGNSENGGFVKFGTLLRFKDKSRDIKAQSFGAYRQQSTLYPIPGPPLSVATVDDGFRDEDFLDKGYLLEFMPSPGLMREFYERWPTLFIYGDQGITESLERTFSQDYTATEDVQAYYAMVQHDFNKLMVLGGVRYERTDIGYEGYQIFKTNSGYFRELDTITDQRKVDFWLPNFQLKYSINRQTNLRAAITYSYARPNFRDVIPYRVQNERSEIRFGNPDLDYPFALNFDFLAEHYWKGRNIISGGVFYKRIDDFIFNYRIFGYEGDPTQANFNKLEIELPLNGREAFVRGAEIQVSSFFNRLPKPWNNLGVMANYTYTDSEGRINKRFSANDNINIVRIGADYNAFFDSENVEVIPLPGQAPNTFNFAFFYDSPRFYLKLAVNYNDVFLSTLGVDPDLDEYYASQWRLDANGYYQINKVVQIFADVRNITNQPLRYYLGSPDNRRILQTEFYSFWARIGARLLF